MNENEDIELEELQTLKQLAQGRAGEDLATQLGLGEAPMEEAPIAEEQDPAAAGGDLASIPPELLAKVIAMLKAQG